MLKNKYMDENLTCKLMQVSLRNLIRSRQLSALPFPVEKMYGNSDDIYFKAWQATMKKKRGGEGDKKNLAL